MAAVLRDFAALEVGRDEPVGQEMIEDVGRRFLLLDHVVQPQDDADGDRLEVGVHEAAAADPLGAVADDGERRALVTGQIETRRSSCRS